jgi:4-alpha-glucanotransferase
VADPSQWPEKALAAVTTHDLPTVAGLWTGSDLEDQRRLELGPNEHSTEAIRQGLAERAHLNPDASVDDIIEAADELLAESPCLLVAATQRVARKLAPLGNTDPGGTTTRENPDPESPHTFG